MRHLVQSRQKNLSYFGAGSPLPIYTSVSLFIFSAVMLIGFQFKPEGWIIFLFSLGFALLLPWELKKYLLLLHIGAVFVGFAGINTKITLGHLTSTSLSLGLAVAVPFLLSRYILQNNKITIEVGRIKEWSKKQYAYLLFAAVASYLVLPFYLHNTGAYANWPSESDTGSLIKLFLGTNGLGIWDELFFVIVLLGVLKHLVSFFWANVSQAVLWTAFLYELGFVGWAPPMIFAFALLQGYVYRKTHSLLYILSIHLTIDFILYLALVNAHHPQMFNVFIT